MCLSRQAIIALLPMALQTLRCLSNAVQAALMQSSSSRSCAHAIKASHTLSPTLLLEGTTQATLGMPHTLPMSAW